MIIYRKYLLTHDVDTLLTPLRHPLPPPPPPLQKQLFADIDSLSAFTYKGPQNKSFRVCTYKL